MRSKNTEFSDLNLVDGNVPPLVAVSLVMKYPGCTLSELLARIEGDLDSQQLDVLRLALLSALHQGIKRGHLVNGPRRECRERGVACSTWMPSDKLASPPPPARGPGGNPCLK